MASSKTVTREQAQRKKEQAAAFMERIGDSDRAADFDGMTVDEYAEHRGLTLTNPYRRNCMAQTKSDLQDALDNIEDILQKAYQPDTSREEAMAAIGDALEELAPDEDEDIEDEDDDDNGNGGD